MGDTDKKEATRLFVEDHKRHVFNTLDLLKSIPETPSKTELIAAGAMLMSIYTGMESIIRHLLILKGYEIPKTEAWHKDMLSIAVEADLIQNELKNSLLDFLKYRHRHIHGYGYMDDWEKIHPLVEQIILIADVFFKEIGYELGEDSL
jgi:hypothetical protein